MADKRTRWIIEASSNIPDINKSLERLIQLQQTQNDLTQQNTTSTALAIQRQREQIESLASAQQKANTTTAAGGKAQTDMMGALRKEYDLLSKTLNGIVQLAAGAWAVGQVKTYVDEVIKAKSSQDGFVASMEQMLGSRLKAEEMNAKLIQIALKSPFETEQLQEVTKKLQGMGVETQKIIPYINMLGDIAAIVGTEKLPLIAKALTDVQSKHVLMAQEIKQFTDNGVPLYDLLAKSMGRPVEEIRKLATEHKLTFVEVEKALMDATKKGGIYYGQMSAQAEQLGGKVANLGDMYTLAKAKIGDYFENGLRAGIKATGEFITATIGSENAITRTLTAVKAMLAMWISYRAAVISVEAAKRANNVTTLSGLAGMQAQQVATVGLTVGTTSLTTAFNGLKVAFMSNPFGFIATAVTSLIGLFYTFKASTIEVSEAQSIEAEALRKTNQEVTNAIERVKGLTVGTNERRKATEELIRKYPELFKSLDAESLGNAQLEIALKRVNAQYREKIQLAIIDAKNNTLLERQIELETQRYDIVKKLREENSAISLKFGDDSQFMAELNRQLGIVQSRIQQVSSTGVTLGGGGFTDGGVNAQMIQNVRLLESETKKVQAEITKNANEQSSIRVKISESENNQKLTALRRQLRNQEISEKEFIQLSEKIGKESTDKKVKDVEDGEDKKKKAKKSSLELSLENDLKELKSAQQTINTKMAILKTEESLRTEITKRTITNHEDQQKRIESIEREYQAKRNKAAMDFAAQTMKEAKKWFDDEVEAHKVKNQKINALNEADTKTVKAMYKDNAKLDQELVDLQIKNKERQAEYNEMYNGEMLKNNKKFWQDSELMYLEGISQEQQKQIEKWQVEKSILQERANALKDSGVRQKEYQLTLIDIEVLNGKIAAGQAENFKTESEIYAKKIAKAREYMEVMYGVVKAVMNMGQAQTQEYEEAWQSASEAVDKFYEYALEANKKSFESQLQNTKLSLEAMTTVWGEFADKQRQIMDQKQSFDVAAASMNNVIENIKKSEQDTLKFAQLLSEGKWLGAVVSFVTNAFQNKKKLNDQLMEMEKLEREQKIESFDMELILIQQLSDAKKAGIQNDYDAKAEAIEKEMALEEAKYAKLKAAAEEFYTANQNRLKEDDIYRAQLVADGEAREVARLEGQKQLLIEEVEARREKGATEAEIAEEVARITNAFNKLIADTHKEYQDAIGDKSKEVALANQEVKAQEADGIDKIQNQLQDSLDALRNKLYDAQVDMQNALLKVARYAAQQQMNIERQKFEAMRQMAIAELEIAGGKAAAKGDPQGILMANIQIKKIMDMPNPFDGRGISEESINAPGITRGTTGPSKTYESPGIRGTRGRDETGGDTGGDTGGNSEEATGSGRPSSRPKFHGDPWLTLGNNPDGIDTIPINAHKGERIMPSFINQFLGPDVTNEALAHGYLQYANFMDRLPDISLPNIPSLQIPDISVNNRSNEMMLDIKKELRDLNKTFADKSLLNVNIDGNRVSISEQRESLKIDYYNTLLKS